MASETELSLLVKLRDEASAQLKEINNAIGQTGNTTKEATTTVGGFSVGWLSVAAAATAAATAIYDAGKNYITFVSGIEKIATSTGFSPDFISQLKYIASISDTNISTFSTAQMRLNDQLGRGNSITADAIRAFNGLHLSISQLKQMTPDQQFEAVATALSGVENMSDRASYGIALFGRSYLDLASAIEDFGRKQSLAAQHAPIITSADIATATQFAEATANLSASWTKFGQSLAPLVDILSQIINLIAEAINKYTELGASWNNILNNFYSGIGSMSPLGALSSYVSGVMPHYAMGGIVSSPTVAMIGESGPEAIVPIGRTGSGGGGNINVTVNVAGSIRSDQEVAAMVRREILLTKSRNFNAGLT